MNILGISISPNDSGACLLRDGKTVNLAHDVYGEDLQSLLANHGLEPADIDLVAVAGRLSGQRRRIMAGSLGRGFDGAGAFVRDMLVWRDMSRRLDKISSPGAGFCGKLFEAGLHESMAAAMLAAAGPEDAAVITMDIGVEYESVCCQELRNGVLTRVVGQSFPHSLELLFSTFMAVLGLKPGDTAGFVELASGGNNIFEDLFLTEVVDLKEDGSFRLDMNRFTYPGGLVLLLAEPSALFGNIRKQKQNIARSLQHLMAEIVLRTLRHMQRKTKLSKVYMNGCAPLDCLDMDSLLPLCGFDEIYVQKIDTIAAGAVLLAGKQGEAGTA